MRAVSLLNNDFLEAPGSLSSKATVLFFVAGRISVVCRKTGSNSSLGSTCSVLEFTK